jgi:uncharacterized protein with von Willebrand factor type A (vWA) domain
VLNLDGPYTALDKLPRDLWMPALITACGTSADRMLDVPRWLDALMAGELPPLDATAGDAPAVQALRQAMGELALPAMARGVKPAALQIIRTALWHLDRLIDRHEAQPRLEAIQAMAQSFKAEWEVQRASWEQITALLLGLGDLALMQWDAMQGRLTARDWAEAKALSEHLAKAPAIQALIQQLGRGLPRSSPSTPRPRSAQDTQVKRSPVVWRSTLLPDAPGETHGIRLGANVSRMVPADAAQLRHPVLRKLWRARLAEARLQVWDESALLVEAVHDPRSHHSAYLTPEATTQDRGPMIVCVDTSGSMKGAPEHIAKAVVLEAARVAHREGRRCMLLAFGGPGEMLEWQLDLHAQGPGARGLDALLSFVSQAFDGGTDIATPLARAVDLVNDHGWHEADLLLVSDGEFGVTAAALARLDHARDQHGLRVQGLLVGDRETIGLLEVCDQIHWVRDWRRLDLHNPHVNTTLPFTPVHTSSLTALYFPGALSERAARHKRQ